MTDGTVVLIGRSSCTTVASENGVFDTRLQGGRMDNGSGAVSHEG